MHAGALFWLLDSNLGLNSEFVCSLFGLEKKNLDLKKEKKKKRKNNFSTKPSQQPGLFSFRPSAGPPIRPAAPPPALADRRAPPVSGFLAPRPASGSGSDSSPTRRRRRAAAGPRASASRCLY
jgi:hypothetical protein